MLQTGHGDATIGYTVAVEIVEMTVSDRLPADDRYEIHPASNTVVGKTNRVRVAEPASHEAGFVFFQLLNRSRWFSLKEPGLFP